jgi:hypothetical protein
VSTAIGKSKIVRGLIFFVLSVFFFVALPAYLITVNLLYIVFCKFVFSAKVTSVIDCVSPGARITQTRITGYSTITAIILFVFHGLYLLVIVCSE